MTENDSFLKLPKVIFSPEYKEISVAGKVIYALLLERHNLSVQNKWLDKQGETYIYFTEESLAEFLDISVSTVARQLKELEGLRLITKKRQGRCKPDIIKVKPVAARQIPKDSIITYDIEAYERLINN